LVVDIAIGVVLGLLAGTAGWTSEEYPNPGLVTGLLVGGAGLALCLRRLRPTASFVAAMGLLAVPAVLFGSYQAGTSLLVALVACFSALAHGVSVRLFVLVGTLAAAALGGREWPGWLYGFVFTVVVCGLAGVGGWLTRRLRETTAANIALRELVELESAAATRAAVEDERARVARELHDILSHSLGVVVLQTTAAEHAWGSDPSRARQSLHAARITALEAVDQLRTLLAVVHSDPTSGWSPVPRVEDLTALAERTDAAGFHVEMAVSGTLRPIPALIQASIYRVAQEGLANSLKHSGARGCRIQLDYRTDRVVVSVEDDAPSSGTGSGSYMGLRGLRERAALVGGDVEVGPAIPDGTGWCLRAVFPA
jgi:signal transduction histidine kinase